MTIAPRRPRVLIVDDQAVMARSIGRALRSVADVVAEEQPAAALDRVSHGEGFDLVLCDVMTPGMCGPEVFERMIASAPELRAGFVFMSGGMEGRIREQVEATGRPFLEKPIAAADLRELLRQVTQGGR